MSYFQVDGMEIYFFGMLEMGKVLAIFLDPTFLGTVSIISIEYFHFEEWLNINWILSNK